MNELQTTLPLTSIRSAAEAAERELADTCSADTASWAVRMIIGSYPNRSVPDADTYVTQLAALLTTYPTWVVKDLAHPKTGIVSRSPFLPTLSEIRAVCDKQLQSRYRAIHRWRQTQKQIADERIGDDIPDQEKAEMAEKLRNLAAQIGSRVDRLHRIQGRTGALGDGEADGREVDVVTRRRRTQCDPAERDLSEYNLE